MTRPKALGPPPDDDRRPHRVTLPASSRCELPAVEDLDQSAAGEIGERLTLIQNANALHRELLRDAWLRGRLARQPTAPEGGLHGDEGREWLIRQALELAAAMRDDANHAGALQALRLAGHLAGYLDEQAPVLQQNNVLAMIVQQLEAEDAKPLTIAHRSKQNGHQP